MEGRWGGEAQGVADPPPKKSRHFQSIFNILTFDIEMVGGQKPPKFFLTKITVVNIQLFKDINI
jgi:hypothetical protein